MKLRRGRALKLVFASLAAVILLAALSGCAVLRTLTYSNNSVKAGHKTTAKVSVTPVPATSMAKAFRFIADRGTPPRPERPFFAMISETEHPLQFREGVWDPKGVLNDGKRKLVTDPDLAAQITNSETCQELLGGGGPRARGVGNGFKLLRTNRPVTFTSKEVRKVVPASLPIKAPKGDKGEIPLIVLISGAWIDDGDNVPEDPGASDDQIDCGGLASSTLKVIK